MHSPTIAPRVLPSLFSTVCLTVLCLVGATLFTVMGWVLLNGPFASYFPTRYGQWAQWHTRIEASTRALPVQWEQTPAPNCPSLPQSDGSSLVCFGLQIPTSSGTIIGHLWNNPSPDLEVSAEQPTLWQMFSISNSSAPVPWHQVWVELDLPADQWAAARALALAAQQMQPHSVHVDPDTLQANTVLSAQSALLHTPPMPKGSPLKSVLPGPDAFHSTVLFTDGLTLPMTRTTLHAPWRLQVSGPVSALHDLVRALK